ncbi:MAG TPA: MFS transporter [Caulobacteraceae bacterium]|nr:MFS transporter [Caulobacteraceae bacterium]
MTEQLRTENGVGSPPKSNRRAQAGVLVACTVGNMVGLTVSVTTVFSLFLVPISQEFRWPRATVSGVLALLAVIGVIVSPLAGRLADRFGPRRVILAGQLLFAPAVAALSLAKPSVFQFYLLFGLVGLAGSIASSAAAYTKMICSWFDDARGTALGVMGGVGNGVGAAIFPFVAIRLLERFGWRDAWVGIALIVLCVGVPIMAALLRDPPAPSAPGLGTKATAPSGLSPAQALRTGPFWLILIAIALGAGCMTAVFVHVVPLLTDRRFDEKLATNVLITFALVTAGWQVVVGWLLDRTASPRVVVPMYISAIAGLGLLTFAGAPPGLFAGGALLGIGLGAEYGALPYLVSRYFGLRAFGVISGLMYSVVILSQGITPVLMDAVFDRTGSYRPAIYAVSALLLASSGLMFLLPRLKRRPPLRDAKEPMASPIGP